MEDQRIWPLFLLAYSVLTTQGEVRGFGSLEEPHFLTEGRHYRVVQMETLTLPCRVVNLGMHIRAWKKGIAILTAGSVKVTPDDRISLVQGYDLEIRHVTPQDEGDYVCQIATLRPQEITHTVEVLEPPQIQGVSGGGLVEARKGTPVTLGCSASGKPTPFFQWRRRTNTTLPGLRPMNGSTITMGHVTRHQAGVYQCIASNGVGNPALRDVTLRVLYAPEVDVEEPWVHSGIGNQAVLSCIVYAEPPAEVRWYRSSLRLDVTDDHHLEKQGNRHRLVIRQVQLQDLDNYTCEAHNNLGKARQHVVLSGKPHMAVFKSPQTSRWRDSYNISWSVFSYTPIEEYRLYFRRKQLAGLHIATNNYGRDKWGNFTYWYMKEWTDVTLPAGYSDDVTQETSYLIRGLEPATQYEAKVQARNSFGWNKMTELFLFTTRDSDGYTWESTREIHLPPESEIRDLGVIASSKGSRKSLLDVVVLALCHIIWVWT